MRPRKTVPSILKGWVLVVVLAVLGCTRKESAPGSQKTDEAQPPFPAVTNAKKTKAVVYSAVSTVGNLNARKSEEVRGYGLIAVVRGARFQVESGNVTIPSPVGDGRG